MRTPVKMERPVWFKVATIRVTVQPDSRGSTALKVNPFNPNNCILTFMSYFCKKAVKCFDIIFYRIWFEFDISKCHVYLSPFKIKFTFC